MVDTLNRGSKAKMTFVGVNLKGFDEVQLNMTKWGKSVQHNGAQVVDEALDYGLGVAEGLCPVKTGALKESLHKTFDPATLAGRFGSDLDYAIYPELGTRRMPATPYLYPGWKQAQAYLRGNLRRVVQV